MNTRILAIHLPFPPPQALLPELASELIRFSPTVGIRPPDTLYMDIAPTKHLFRGEEAVLRRLQSFLSEKKIAARLALADDAATAGILAQDAGIPRIVRSGESAEALSPLSTHALLFLADPFSPPQPREVAAADSVISVLTMLGLTTLGQFARLPASTIGNRFGHKGVELHRRARGLPALPFHPFTPERTYREATNFEDPVACSEPVLFAAKTLLHRLEARMRSDMNAACEMTAYLETQAAEETEVRVPLHLPLRRAAALLPILKERLSSIRLSAPLVSLALELTLPVRTRPGQFRLFSAHEKHNEPFEELLGRLIARLGPTVVSAAEIRQRYRPEASWSALPLGERSSNPIKDGAYDGPARPTWLLAPPEPLRAERCGGRLVLKSPKERYAVTGIEGPERLKGEWWEKEPLARDYFVADTAGPRLWIFRPISGKSQERFFLHGYFD